ncbi:hypothetical protein GXW82_09300 [Streptacidiphilus sp. 4-A2]|nr:hypothetical protein [Streptacidiphilus sp. 4-A2]
MAASTESSARRRVAATLGTAALLLTLCTALGGVGGHGHAGTLHRTADTVATTAAPTPSGSAQPNDEDWG